MNATLMLDASNNRFEFVAPDFFLRFAVSYLITKIEQVLENDSGYFILLCDGEEIELYLPDVLSKMGLKWDFSKYETEVLL